MKILSVILALQCLFTTTPAAVSATQQLDSDSYNEVTGSGKNGMIKFYQPWCGHCKKMKPDWDRLADEAHSSVFIADVNCSEQGPLCKEHDVWSYPTIKVFVDGTMENYSGPRTYEAFSAYVDSELASKCDIKNVSKTCSARAEQYIKKWKAKSLDSVEKERHLLEDLSLKSRMMEDYMRAWLRERRVILSQLAKQSVKKKKSWW